MCLATTGGEALYIQPVYKLRCAAYFVPLGTSHVPTLGRVGVMSRGRYIPGLVDVSDSTHQAPLFLSSLATTGGSYDTLMLLSIRYISFHSILPIDQI